MHIMIDIETLGTGLDATVLSVGACTMERIPGLRRTFHVRLDWKRQGRDIDPGTVAWWMEQSAEARAKVFADGTDQLSAIASREAFLDYVSSVGGRKGLRVWCHGATFDAPILENLWGSAPWTFWNVRCTRTLYELAGVAPVRGDDHHDALADAMAQTDAVWHALDKLNIDNLPT